MKSKYLPQLESETEYSFWVKASTSIGVGDNSTVVRQMTQESSKCTFPQSLWHPCSVENMVWSNKTVSLTFDWLKNEKHEKKDYSINFRFRLIRIQRHSFDEKNSFFQFQPTSFTTIYLWPLRLDQHPPSWNAKLMVTLSPRWCGTAVVVTLQTLRNTVSWQTAL